MKQTKITKWISLAALLLFSSAGFAQNSGVVFPDGSVHYPNGQVVTRDGTVFYPNGTANYPNNPVYTNDGPVTTRRNDGRWYDRTNQNNQYDQNNRYRRNLPPGQAKKLYGAKSAREYAPGQQKKYRGYDNYEGGYRGNGKGHKGKGHK